jgi:eukaryotic-like serine/threonine-protein kinase
MDSAAERGGASIFETIAVDATVGENRRADRSGDARTLAPGSVLVGRYEILKLLGEGGMGAVYKAQDRELGRLVALKVIRPELGNNPKILERFKQELILSRQIGHRNVIRIFDLGVEDQVKFITMEYIEGEDLSSLLEKRPFTVEETVHVIRQVCLALDAAHGEGIVHRDLKPQNIMTNSEGRIWVMDFGLARNLEDQGMTQSGMILGTPAYMSPEQAKGERADHRADLFALGVMMYEMLTGTVPYKAETVLASLLKRVQEIPRTPIELSPDLPPALSEIVMRCLAIDVNNRYQSASEIIADLDEFLGSDPNLSRLAQPIQGSSSTSARRQSIAVSLPAMQAPAAPVLPPTAPPPASRRKWIFAGAGAAVAIAGGLGFWLLSDGESTPSGAPSKPVTLLVADFQNDTGDSVFDGALEPTFGFALEGANFISNYSRAAAMRTAGQLKPGITRLDEEVSRLVAVREGVSAVVAGSVRKDGGTFRLAARVIDSVTGNELARAEESTSGKDKILALTGKLAGAVRKALGDRTPESVQLAAAETFTAASLEAAQAYSRAQDARFAGKTEEAIKLYQEAVKLDPNLGSALYGLAVTYSSFERNEANRYYELAMSNINRLSDREKYRLRGGYYLTQLNHQKALDEFTELTRLYPADFSGLSNLAYVYYQRREMRKALEEGRKALDVYPKYSLARSNCAMFAMYSGDLEMAEKEASAVVEANPKYLKGYDTLALARLAANQPAKAMEIYGRMQAVDARGASLGAMGLADVALYQGRVADAIAILTKAIAEDENNKYVAGVAKKTAVLGSAQLLAGNTAAALSAFRKASDLRKEEMVLYTSAIGFIEAGQPAEAMKIAKLLSERLESDPQIYAKLIEGEAELRRGRNREALALFEEAQKLTDTWLGRFSMGRAYLAMGNFAEADSEFDKCLKRKGEATGLFLDEVQTYHHFAPVLYYIGRAQEGLKSSGAAESYKAFLAIKPDSTEPLVLDARKRLKK